MILPVMQSTRLYVRRKSRTSTLVAGDGGNGLLTWLLEGGAAEHSNEIYRTRPPITACSTSFPGDILPSTRLKQITTLRV